MNLTMKFQCLKSTSLFEGVTDLSPEIVEVWAGYLASNPKAHQRNQLIINIAYEGAASRQRTLVLIRTPALCESLRDQLQLAKRWGEERVHKPRFAILYKAKRFSCHPVPDGPDLSHTAPWTLGELIVPQNLLFQSKHDSELPIFEIGQKVDLLTSSCPATYICACDVNFPKM